MPFNKILFLNQNDLNAHVPPLCCSTPALSYAEFHPSISRRSLFQIFSDIYLNFTNLSLLFKLLTHANSNVIELRIYWYRLMLLTCKCLQNFYQEVLPQFITQLPKLLKHHQIADSICRYSLNCWSIRPSIGVISTEDVNCYESVCKRAYRYISRWDWFFKKTKD